MRFTQDHMSIVADTETRVALVDQSQDLDERAALELIIAHAIETAAEPLTMSRDLAYGIVSAEDADLCTLDKDEYRVLSNRACGSKRASWISGREAARLATSKLGVRSAAILRGDGGEPLWPVEITGSITHCHPWSVAVVARQEKRSLSIGVDLESSDRMRRADPKSLLRLICTGREMEWVRNGDLAARLTMIFSAKEALYKALYPLCKRYIDFTEVELSWAQELGRFRSKFLTSFNSSLHSHQSCEISCTQYQHLFFTCSVIELDE